MLKINFFFCFWKGQSTWAEDKLTPAVNLSRAFKSHEASHLSLCFKSVYFFFLFIHGMIPYPLWTLPKCICISGMFKAEADKHDFVPGLWPCLQSCSHSTFSWVTHPYTGTSCLLGCPENGWGTKEGAEPGKCCACVLLWPKGHFFAYPWGCGTMSPTDMCHLWWHEHRRNVPFWLQACRSSCNSFPALPIDWLIRALLSQSRFLLSAQHSHGELRSQLMDAAPGDVCGCSVSWGVTGLDPGNAQALGKHLQIHILGISLKWSYWDSCKKANYINEQHWAEFNPPAASSCALWP